MHLHEMSSNAEAEVAANGASSLYAGVMEKSLISTAICSIGFTRFFVIKVLYECTESSSQVLLPL